MSRGACTRSVIAHDLDALPRCEGSPDIQMNRVAHEPDAAVAQCDVHPAEVKAGRLELPETIGRAVGSGMVRGAIGVEGGAPGQAVDPGHAPAAVPRRG